MLGRNTMKGQACDPCAKRKVRCDRGDPTCSNCKRRRQDRCVYPDLLPSQRIKQLEETIRMLRADSSPNQDAHSKSGDRPLNSGAATPTLQRDDNRCVYSESQGWQAWINVTRFHGGVNQLGPDFAHRPAKHLPHAFGGNFVTSDPESAYKWPQIPFTRDESSRLWQLFLQRVEPLVKMSFKWTLDRLQSALANDAEWIQLSDGERLLAISSCFYGAVSLSREESRENFGKSKPQLVTEFRGRCEDSFRCINILAINDIDTLKALCLYVKANVDSISSQSLWSLMGLVCRSAELLGIHRDGKIIGLSEVETEQRRRLWWQIQHIDLIMAIKNGTTPLTFTADWDVELPLNIDDQEMQSALDPLPEESTGLTALSYSLFTYWIIAQQHKFRHENQQRLNRRSLLNPLADQLIASIETGLQARFLQYCDPIKPLHLQLQISARAVICILRLRRLHELRLNPEIVNPQVHSEYFSLCMQEIGYTVATFSQPSLKPFFWFGEMNFVWHALIAMLVDIPHSTDISKLKEAWNLVESLYSTAEFLSDFSGDKRRIRAAELIISAWNACESRPDLHGWARPEFIYKLETGIQQINSADAEENHERNHQEATVVDDPAGGDISFSDFLELDFAEIEWSFWQ